LIIFGAGKLPQIGENMGKAIRNFQSATEKEKIAATPKKPDEPSGGSK
jgi:sec-independent protein translocase protein TatA